MRQRQRGRENHKERFHFEVFVGIPRQCTLPKFQSLYTHKPQAFMVCLCRMGTETYFSFCHNLSPSVLFLCLCLPLWGGTFGSPRLTFAWTLPYPVLLVSCVWTTWSNEAGTLSSGKGHSCLRWYKGCIFRSITGCLTESHVVWRGVEKCGPRGNDKEPWIHRPRGGSRAQSQGQEGYISTSYRQVEKHLLENIKKYNVEKKKEMVIKVLKVYMIWWMSMKLIGIRNYI